MKTAFDAPNGVIYVQLRDGDDALELAQTCDVRSAQHTALLYRGAIERIVEHVQADARTQLEREVERLRDENAAMRQQLVDAERTIESLRAENARLSAEHAEYLEFVAGANDMRAEEHEQIRKANGA